MTAAAAAHPPADERRRLVAAVAASPRNPELRRALAAALAKSREPRAALEQYRAVLGLLPNDADAAADLGLMALRCRAEPEALALVRAAATANPGHSRLWQVLGLLHRALDDLEPAMAAFDRAASLAPRDALIAHGRARARFDAGKPAVDLFERARQLAPADQSVLTGLMAALIAAGRSEDAVAAAREALRRNPDWTAVQSTLASHLWAMGDREGFTAPLEAALRSSPGNILLWKELISTLMHAGSYEAALEAIGRGRAAVADPHLIFDANEAICRTELGDFDGADRLFERLSELDDPVMKVRHVRHLLRTGRPDEAERIGLPLTRTANARTVWPYLSIAWRMTGNPEWQWLEGDPRLVGIYELGEAIPSLEALAGRLRALHLTTHPPLIQSVRGGTQTDGMLFARTEPEIRSLRSAVVEAVQAHIGQLPPPDPRHPMLGRNPGAVRFTGSWSIRLSGGGRHVNHIHPAGWFSSALYVSLPEPAERGPEPAGWLALGEPPEELHVDLPALRLVEPKPGRLVLFPSIMWHGTRPFAAGERLTVAFDVAPPA